LYFFKIYRPAPQKQVFIFIRKGNDEFDEQYLVVAQKLFAIPWKEVAIIDKK